MLKMKGILFSLITIVCIDTSMCLLPCPDECECYFDISTTFCADCSGKMLKELPKYLDKNIQSLDLSNNLLTTIPDGVTSFIFLEKLNISGNRIKSINAGALLNLTQLKVLDLSNNEIDNWNSIQPNELLLPAISLERLVLSNNNLQIFSYLNATEFLVSETLTTLELSNCGITHIGKVAPISRLTSLKTLILSHNPLKWVSPFVSATIENLDLSYCYISFLSGEFLSYLPLLTHLVISHNYRLTVKKESFLSSTSLKTLDVTYCNMDGIKLNGLPNLEILLLKGNMIRHLSSGEFRNNSQLEYLDLSSNAIGNIHQNAFFGLTSLKHLNLSINVIPQLHEDVFSKTPQLIELIISRNYLSSIDKINAKALKLLDLSLCEIQYIEHDAFQNLTHLIDLNLSRNLLSYIPCMKSHSLQILDLSFNRLSIVDNMTFQFLPELTTLHLSANRFTSTWKDSYFANNIKLSEITLHDNMWRCDCYDQEMKHFFSYITNEPAKLWDINTLTCHSPPNVSGDNWIRACYYDWYPNDAVHNSKALNFFLAVMCAFFLCFVILYMVRRTKRKRQTIEEEERQRRAADTRDRLRELQMRREQEEQRNAPDPRDLISPPSYAEALLMPKLDGSFHSLSNLDNDQRKQKKRARRRTRSSGDLLEDNITFEERRKNRRTRNGDIERQRHRSQSTRDINSADSDEMTSSEQTHQLMTRMYESDL